MASFAAVAERLTESRFKPLLFRMVDWAESTQSSGGEGLPNGWQLG